MGCDSTTLTLPASPEPAHDLAKHSRRRQKEHHRTSRKWNSQHHDYEPMASTPLKTLRLIPTALDAHRRDLFKTTPVDLQGISLEALDEHLQVLHTEELVLQIAGGTQHPVLTSLFPAALQDPCLFTCFIAATQSMYEHRRSTGRFEPSDHLLGLQAKGLSSVRDRLMQAGDGQDDNLIAGIVELMVTDSVCGNIRSLISHQRGARKLMALRKGDENDPLYKTMLGVLMVIEFYVALVQFLAHDTTTPPAGKNPLRYLKHPFPASVCVSVSVLPQGLQDIILTGRLSLQTIGMLQTVNSWSSAVGELSSGSDSVPAAYRRLFAEPMQCSRSAVFILRHLRQCDSQLTMEYILCLGITIVIKHQSSINITDHIDDELLQAFTRTIKQFAHPSVVESDAIIWLTTVVAWRKHATFQAYSKQLIDHLIKVHDFAENLHTIQSTWSKFLWYDRFGGPWTRMWQEGLDRTRQRDGGSSRSGSCSEPRHRGGQSCVFTRGVANIKKEEPADSTYSLVPSLTLSRSLTQSDKDAGFQSHSRS